MNHWIIAPVILPALLAPLIAFVMRHDIVLARAASSVGTLALLAISVGLTIMAERAREIGARFSVDSRPARGTTVRIEVADGSNPSESDQSDVVDRHEDALGGEGADAHDRSVDVDGGGAVG